MIVVLLIALQMTETKAQIPSKARLIEANTSVQIIDTLIDVLAYEGIPLELITENYIKTQMTTFEECACSAQYMFYHNGYSLIATGIVSINGQVLRLKYEGGAMKKRAFVFLDKIVKELKPHLKKIEYRF